MEDSISLISFTGLNGQIIMELVFLLMLGIYVIYSAVLYYHWSTYSSTGKITIYTAFAYVLLTVPVIITLALITYVF